MNILNTQAYEKLKIRPVNVNNLKNIENNDNVLPFEYQYIDPKTITMKDVGEGYIVRTDEHATNYNIWIVISKEYMRHFTRVYLYDYPAMMRLDKGSRISYLSMGTYEKNWPDTIYNLHIVTGVWKTNLDMNIIHDIDSFIMFYKKYKLDNIFNDENI